MNKITKINMNKNGGDFHCVWLKLKLSALSNVGELFMRQVNMVSNGTNIFRIIKGFMMKTALFVHVLQDRQMFLQCFSVVLSYSFFINLDQSLDTVLRASHSSFHIENILAKLLTRSLMTLI